MTALICTICMIMGAAAAASADTNFLRSLPSPALKAFVSGNTFDARISGYGWGEEDDVTSLSLDFTVMEPLTFAPADIESLSEGDAVSAGFELYTVASTEESEGSIKVTPEEEWLSPITFTLIDDGVYVVENDDGLLSADSFSFPAHLGNELVYVNPDGDQLTAAELLKDLVEGSLDTDTSIPKITFDEEGYIVELNFSE